MATNYIENVADVPVGKIIFTLPVEVILDTSTWFKTINRKQNGSVAVILEFVIKDQGYHTQTFEKTIML